VRLFCGVTAEYAQHPGERFLLDDEFHPLPTMSLRSSPSRTERIFRENGPPAACSPHWTPYAPTTQACAKLAS
jgi:hypothetical protein